MNPTKTYSTLPEATSKLKRSHQHATKKICTVIVYARSTLDLVQEEDCGSINAVLYTRNTQYLSESPQAFLQRSRPLQTSRIDPFTTRSTFKCHMHLAFFFVFFIIEGSRQLNQTWAIHWDLFGFKTTVKDGADRPSIVPLLRRVSLKIQTA
jgi:hypothetical protein